MPTLAKREAAALTGDTITKMVAMSRDQLAEITGMNKRLDAMQKHLGEANALTGKARELMNEKLDERMSPRIDGYDFEYMIKDAKRQADPKKGGGPAACC